MSVVPSQRRPQNDVVNLSTHAALAEYSAPGRIRKVTFGVACHSWSGNSVREETISRLIRSRLSVHPLYAAPVPSCATTRRTADLRPHVAIDLDNGASTLG